MPNVLGCKFVSGSQMKLDVGKSRMQKMALLDTNLNAAILQEPLRPMPMQL